jgi:hypothetical protein
MSLGRSWLLLLASVATTWLALPGASAAVPERNVVVLYGGGRAVPRVVTLDAALDQTLRERIDARVHIFSEFTDIAGAHGAAYADDLAEFLRRM